MIVIGSLFSSFTVPSECVSVPLFEPQFSLTHVRESMFVSVLGSIFMSILVTVLVLMYLFESLPLCLSGFVLVLSSV